MSLITLREAVATKLTENVSELAKVYTHGGRFDNEALGKYATHAPCAVVAILGMPDSYLEGGQLVGDFQWGCFIVAKDMARVKKDALALSLLEAVVRIIRPEETWGDADAHMIEKIRADNLFNGKMDATGVVIWAVTWRQKYDLNVFNPDTLDDFLTYNVKYDLEESADSAYEAEDTVTLEGPEE